MLSPSHSSGSRARAARARGAAFSWLAGAAALLATLASGPAAHADLPPNRLGPSSPNVYLPRTDAEKVISAFQGRASSLVAAQGGALKINTLWDNDAVNARVDREGKDWIINVFGGLVRREELTLDGFALVLCHELGHHLAGYPFVDGWPWPMSAEGMSDWYAAHHCAPLLWRPDTSGNAAFRKTTPASVRARCDREYSTANEQNLCYRIAMASKSVNDLMAVIDGSGTVSFDANDTDKVPATSVSHPLAQCRLDTMEAGALCTIPPNTGVIPGLKLGTKRNGPDAERESALSSCMPASALVGARLYNKQDIPGCWFKPQVTSK